MPGEGERLARAFRDATTRDLIRPVGFDSDDEAGARSALRG